MAVSRAAAAEAMPSPSRNISVEILKSVSPSTDLRRSIGSGMAPQQERKEEVTCFRGPRVAFGAGCVVGGILKVNGFEEFLGNYSLRKTFDDPLREGLALLGTARPDQWLRPADWAELTADLGLIKRIIPRADQDGDKAHGRGIGIVLTAHREETFHAEIEGERLTLRLDKDRRRFESGKVSTRYRFEVIQREKLPEGSEEGDGEVDR